MNIAIFVDKQGSAIWRLAKSIEKHNKHFNIQVVPVHPKRASADELFQAQDAMRWADLIDVHYWKSGEVLRTTFAPEFEKKKKIVCHFNPYDLEKLDFKSIYNEVVVGNQEMSNRTPYAYLIPYAIDLDFFKYNPSYTKDKTVHMSVARIEGKKGVKEVAEVCKELGYKFILVGKVSDGDYMREVIRAGEGVIDFRENATEDELLESYYQSAVHVCNSVDNFESGTLPMLEAMACGVPVLTRKIGHAPELHSKGNIRLRDGKVDDLEDLKNNLKELMENKDMRLRMRDQAWQTVKNRNEKKMARQYSKLYYQVLGEGKPLASVIIPTYDRGESLIEALVGVNDQKYPHVEVIVVDSGKYDMGAIVRRFQKESKTPIKYIRFQREGYTLAEARNRGVIESEGEVLVFCDDRLKMMPDAVENFVQETRHQTWLWGVKDGVAKAFVENFSSIRRADLIRAGMFCERIDRYGGLSQEVRDRFTELGYNFEPVTNANAEAIVRAKGKDSRREDIIESKLTLFKMYG